MKSSNQSYLPLLLKAERVTDRSAAQLESLGNEVEAGKQLAFLMMCVYICAGVQASAGGGSKQPLDLPPLLNGHHGRTYINNKTGELPITIPGVANSVFRLN